MPDFKVRAPLAIFTPQGTEADEGAIKQMDTCMDYDDALAGVLNADHHLGYSMPIGGGISYANHISPSGVGYDIGCGNMAVATSLLYSDIQRDMRRIMDEVTRRISFGMGQPAAEEVKDHPVFDRIQRDAPLSEIRKLLPTARKQLGTVGSGNHYVDIFVEDGTGRVWIGVHFGSRGLGHKIASGYLALSQNLPFDGRAAGGEMYSPPVLFRTDEWLGYSYLEAMAIAGEYAYAGRETVVEKVLDILGNPSVYKTVHNHHNFAWREEHNGEWGWVVRKGCTPLWPGQQGFVGGSMGENAVIIEGREFRMDDVKLSGKDRAAYETAAMSLFSAPHGAGRVMSRTEAKGKQRKRWICISCGNEQRRGEPGWDGTCPDPECYATGNAVTKTWVRETEGKIDWRAARKRLGSQGIHLRGGDADEAPGAYKRLPEVLEAHRAYVNVIHQLRPVGVAMAGSGIKDPYKD